MKNAHFNAVYFRFQRSEQPVSIKTDRTTARPHNDRTVVWAFVGCGRRVDGRHGLDQGPNTTLLLSTTCRCRKLTVGSSSSYTNVKSRLW